MNILVAEDDAVTRILLATTLRQLGHVVAEATSGTAAWEMWSETRQPLVISDWMMPGMDGLDFCRRIRAAQPGTLTYVMLLTAHSGKQNFLEAMDAGVDDFIVKPFARDQLSARLRVATRILDLHEGLRAAHDVLEARVNERTAELEKALKTKSEFLSRASHELRTPMNHVLGFAQLLELDPLSNDQAKSVDHILTSGRHLLKLIDQILEVSKCDSEHAASLDARTSAIFSELPSS